MWQSFLDSAGQFWSVPVGSLWMHYVLFTLCVTAVLMNVAILRASNLYSIRLKEAMRQLFCVAYILLGARIAWLTWFDLRTPIPFASMLSLMMTALGVNFEAFVALNKVADPDRLTVQNSDIERQLSKTGQMKTIRQHGRRG